MAQQEFRQELRTKLQRLAQFLDRHDLGGVLLVKRSNFAWITGGRDNHVANNTSTGVAVIFATADEVLCLADTGEAPRMEDEVLAGTGIEVVSVPWYDKSAAAIKVIEIMAGRKVAADADPWYLKLHRLPQEFNQLRWSLLPQEVERYREGARRASAAVERACRAVEFGQTEWEIAGLMEYHLHGSGLNTVATVVAADERVARFRNPMPTDKKVEHYAMVAVAAEWGGLTSCLTRFVSFRSMTEVEDRLAAVANIDAAAILSTCPGTTLGNVFDVLEQAYAANGFPMEWKHRPQGGPTGYARREVVATPDSEVAVRDNQPFAWSPSVPGARSEDTVLCTGDGGFEVLTTPSEDWPVIQGRFGDKQLPRAGILVR